MQGRPADCALDSSRKTRLGNISNQSRIKPQDSKAPVSHEAEESDRQSLLSAFSKHFTHRKLYRPSVSHTELRDDARHTAQGVRGRLSQPTRGRGRFKSPRFGSWRSRLCRVAYLQNVSMGLRWKCRHRTAKSHLQDHDNVSCSLCTLFYATVALRTNAPLC
jgi:hypothetical protein